MNKDWTFNDTLKVFGALQLLAGIAIIGINIRNLWQNALPF
ncbi:hypothetical protein [Solitalea longa]|nr:hypothetical protein [Solitalea longa]